MNLMEIPMSSFRTLICVGLMGLAAAGTWADDATPIPSTVERIGDSARSLLALQRSGQQAGPELPMLGAASALAYQRYLDSHKYRIPENMSTLLRSTSSTATAK